MSKKKLSKDDIISSFMNYRIDSGKTSVEISNFLKSSNISKKEFEKYFSNFDTLEKYIYQLLFEKTLILLDENSDYATFEKKNKLISFYYTFFELLSVNRTYIELSLSTLGYNELKYLSKLKKHFTRYVKKLNIDSFDLKSDSLNKTKSNITKELAWFQLLGCIKFWLEDTSVNFEKTDILIEKSINTTFELINTQPLESLIDLGKFLLKEKIKK